LKGKTANESMKMGGKKAVKIYISLKDWSRGLPHPPPPEDVKYDTIHLKCCGGEE